MIQLYQPNDSDSIVDIWYRASLIAHDFVPADFWKKERATIREVYLPTAQTWVWREADEILGFIAMLDNEIGGLFIAPEAQGRGIGRALVNDMRRRFGPLSVRAFKQNENAQAFYRAMGFVTVSEGIEEHTGQPEVLMEMPR